MKQKILIILSSLFMLTSISKAQNVCITWSDDYGSGYKANLKSLEAEARYYEAQRKILYKKELTYGDRVLLRAHARQVEFHKLNEYQIQKNKTLTSPLKGPQFQIIR